MRTWGCWIIASAASLAVTLPALAQAPVYDIRAELVYEARSSLYAVQIRNVGPTIPAPWPLLVAFQLVLPAGLTLTNWTLNGMSCAPGPPTAGPQTISCSGLFTAAWKAGTILAKQNFVVRKLPGARVGPVCVRHAALQFRVMPFGVYELVTETNAVNNSICV